MSLDAYPKLRKDRDKDYQDQQRPQYTAISFQDITYQAYELAKQEVKTPDRPVNPSEREYKSKCSPDPEGRPEPSGSF
jgi:hypothetical protein